MTVIINNKHWYWMGIVILSILMSVVISETSFSHGPKGHTEAFTALQAIKKGTAAFDRLIETGKLEESWETGLTGIEVGKFSRKDKKEFIVKFSRSDGAEKALFIFFSEKGEYKGSNFTGE